MFITEVTLDNVPWYHEEFSRLDAERSSNSSQNVFYLISSVAPANNGDVQLWTTCWAVANSAQGPAN